MERDIRQHTIVAARLDSGPVRLLSGLDGDEPGSGERGVVGAVAQRCFPEHHLISASPLSGVVDDIAGRSDRAVEVDVGPADNGAWLKVF